MLKVLGEITWGGPMGVVQKCVLKKIFTEGSLVLMKRCAKSAG